MAETVRDVMTQSPATLRTDDSVFDAAVAMSTGDFGAIVVVSDGEQVRGILTDRDIVVRTVAEGKDPRETQIDEAYTTEPTTVSADDDIDAAVKALRDANVRRLPVVDGTAVVGIVSIGDLAQARDEKSALADISSAAPNN